MIDKESENYYYKSFKKDLLYSYIDDSGRSIHQTFLQGTLRMLYTSRDYFTTNNIVTVIPSKGRGIISSDEPIIIYYYG
jgi:hypothetical protein